MSEPIQLQFPHENGDQVLLPEQCSLSVACYEAEEVRQAIAMAMEQMLYGLALAGMNLRALDGITMSHDCRADATALQCIPEGQIPLEMTDRADSMEMARTVAVWRGNELRFHMVFRLGIGVMMFSPEKDLQRLAQACIAHEAAHVEHEGHLYRTFPNIYGRPLECGGRSRQLFLKAMDVWSEYAACRSSAMFRPEAVEEFEGLFCRALEESLSACKDRIAAYRIDQNAAQAFRDVQQLFGDVFIHAGYFMGHLDGLELNLEKHAPLASALLRQHPQIQGLIVRLRRHLHELWLGEDGWQSIEVFAPIYDLIREKMALHGLAFARHKDEWCLVLCEDEGAAESMRGSLADRWARANKPEI